MAEDFDDNEDDTSSMPLDPDPMEHDLDLAYQDDEGEAPVGPRQSSPPPDQEDEDDLDIEAHVESDVNEDKEDGDLVPPPEIPLTNTCATI
jgi:hypothetical protein